MGSYLVEKTMMKIFIRADASVQIGTGHVMRCLTLAGDLVQRGMEVLFVTRDFPGNLSGLIREKGFEVYTLPNRCSDSLDDALEWLRDRWEEDAEETRRLILKNKTVGDRIQLVVDHYALDAKWERALRTLVNQITVIDDLADRYHDCDILLDQNYYRDLDRRYYGLVPDHCRLLLGPKHALLRPEFYAAKPKIKRRGGAVRRVLVFFGGSDPTGETVKALEAMKRLGHPDIITDVVVGFSNLCRAEIEQLCAGMPSTYFHCQVENMAELIAQADLAIGAGGSVTWERCFLGLPALAVTVAKNQVEMIRDLAETGVIWYLGWHEDVNVAKLVRAVDKLLKEPERLREMSERGLGLFD
jgi:UDP-2,4-diacetamido-2,4,6-trideoxy-beta-L-altropyranose hydrolase